MAETRGVEPRSAGLQPAAMTASATSRAPRSSTGNRASSPASAGSRARNLIAPPVDNRQRLVRRVQEQRLFHTFTVRRLVGAVGFEPTISRSRTERVRQATLRPNTLVPPTGIEPAHSTLAAHEQCRRRRNRTALTLRARTSCDNVERTARIELASPDWQPGASPFGHVRSIWYPRQDSNLHNSAFVARRLSLQLHAGTYRSGAGEEIRTPIFSLEG